MAREPQPLCNLVNKSPLDSLDPATESRHAEAQTQADDCATPHT
jgi:hypothetical protein